MAVAELRVNSVTSKRLGKAGLAQLRRNLHAVDCQGCGEGLGTEPPSVAVDEYDERCGDHCQGCNTMAEAKLYHMDCRRPDWKIRHRPLADDGRPAHLTYHTYTLLPQPVLFGGTKQWTPIVLVNPTLEAACLHRRRDKWRVDSVPLYRRRFGMQRSSLGLPLTELDECRLVAQGVRSTGVRDLVLMMDELMWDVSAPRSFVESIEHYAGAVALLTTVIDPLDIEQKIGTFEIQDLANLIDSGDCSVGWVRYFSKNDWLRQAALDQAITILTDRSARSR